MAVLARLVVNQRWQGRGLGTRSLLRCRAPRQRCRGFHRDARDPCPSDSMILVAALADARARRVRLTGKGVS